MPYRTVSALRAALAARQVSAGELANQAIARIEALDARINAVVVRDFAPARTQAEAADQALARGEQRPLLGIPITVKESFNVAGLPTTWGIPGTERVPVNSDAVAVARLKAAGAIILGKTNVPVMLADWQSHNPVYGVTNNPWNAARTPGGSSGGGAAALAAGFVPLEFGSDIAGSLRVPAHFCGVFAHKPSHGIVPMRGMAPPGAPDLALTAPVDLAVVGPMARSAEDLALALDATAGPDEAEAGAYALRLPAPRHAALRDYRVLVIDQHPVHPTAASVRQALGQVAGELERLGCKLGRASNLLPDLTELGLTFTTLLMAFIGGEIPAADYARAREAVGPGPANERDFADVSRRGLVLSHRDWLVADRRRYRIASQWRALFREWDVVLCPVMPTTAFAHDHSEMNARQIRVDGQAVPYGAQSMWSSLATLTGQPSTAMPIGRDEGLPIGMQIIGPSFEDRTTLEFARLLERERGGFVAPPGL
jgi:amidase